ncbi:hypothetical protein [Mycobacteroides chelonae]|uniref:hypothetical protein n=1 Tax=Mycobacteroides chelonae TaxID=1774 RepID=UPI001F1E23DF|nr:hypothetical protein [Mycobacteroides chelonae]
MAPVTRYPNPFPKDRIEAATKAASLRQLFVYGLSSAQRAVTFGAEILGGLAEPEKVIIDAALEASWNEVKGILSADLAAHVPGLLQRIIPEEEEGYSFCNSVVNDAVAATAYAISALTGSVATSSESAYYAAESLFNLADLVLHRNEIEYVTDITCAPILAATLGYIESDLDRMECGITVPEPASIRPRLIAEGQHLARLAD